MWLEHTVGQTSFLTLDEHLVERIIVDEILYFELCVLKGVLRRPFFQLDLKIEIVDYFCIEFT